MTSVKIKECEKPAIEAYWRTLIKPAFHNDTDIRFCHRSGATQTNCLCSPFNVSLEGLYLHLLTDWLKGCWGQNPGVALLFDQLP